MDKKKYVRVDPFTGFPEKDVKEDVPTTSTAGVAATGDDPTVVMKKKKKKLYDGRTSIAKKFVERILKQRESRRLTKEEVELDEVKLPSYKDLIKYKYSDDHGGAVHYSKFGGKDYKWNYVGRKGGKYFIDTEKQPEIRIDKVGVKNVNKIVKEEVELEEKVKQPRQLINPSKEAMVVKNNKVIVVDKKDLKQYTSKGWSLAEDDELDEVLKPKDKKDIDDFVQANKGTGVQNFTKRGNIVDYEGRSLEKSGMGAQQIASIESDPKDSHKIKVHAKMDSRSTQSIVNYLKKSAKKYNIKVEETVKEEPMIEVNELEEAVANLFVKGDNPNQMALKIAKNAKGLGLKSAMMGNQVRVKGSQRQVNDFMRSVLGKSSMGSPTEKGASNPQIDKMLNKQMKEDVFRSNDFVGKIMEKVNDFGNEHELVETNLKVLQNIVKRKQNQKVKFKDKQATVDLFTASAIMKVYDAVKPDNKKKIEKLMNGTLVDFLKLQKFAMKQVKFA